MGRENGKRSKIRVIGESSVLRKLVRERKSYRGAERQSDMTETRGREM